MKNIIEKKIENNLTSNMIIDAILGKPDKKKSYILKTKKRQTEYIFNEDISELSKEEIESLIRKGSFRSIRNEVTII